MKLEFRDYDAVGKDDKMFGLWLHTSALAASPSLVLSRTDLDRACKKKEKSKYPKSFLLEIETCPADDKDRAVPMPSSGAPGDWSSMRDEAGPDFDLDDDDDDDDVDDDDEEEEEKGEQASVHARLLPAAPPPPPSHMSREAGVTHSRMQAATTMEPNRVVAGGPRSRKQTAEAEISEVTTSSSVRSRVMTISSGKMD